jgi:hypothetical protein
MYTLSSEGAYEGTKTATLPTLGIEGRFSAALQT